jgi:hypothetical protein
LRWPPNTLYPLKLALTSPTNGGRSVGIVRWRTETPEFVFVCFVYDNKYQFHKILDNLTTLLQLRTFMNYEQISKWQPVVLTYFKLCREAAFISGRGSNPAPSE